MEHVLPADIENTSMSILSSELERRGITLLPGTEAVVKRVIHATADFDYAENLRFTENAVARGLDCLRAATPIVTDSNMALAGVSKPSLAALGIEAMCFMADPQVAEQARRQGSTRAVAAMALAAERYPGAVLAVGNAPTALYEITAQMERGLRPGLVIGVPVGFVNVVESKERLLAACRRLDVPAIVAMGRKGGSTVAAAILNALLYTAAKTLDPRDRGWN